MCVLDLFCLCLFSTKFILKIKTQANKQTNYDFSLQRNSFLNFAFSSSLPSTACHQSFYSPSSLHIWARKVWEGTTQQEEGQQRGSLKAGSYGILELILDTSKLRGGRNNCPEDNKAVPFELLWPWTLSAAPFYLPPVMYEVLSFSVLQSTPVIVHLFFFFFTISNLRSGILVWFLFSFP